MERQNEIAFACGMKGSGKSHWLLNEFVAHAPRIIHIDPNGEFVDDPDVLMVAGWLPLLDALEACATFKEWRIAVSLRVTPKVNEYAQLFALLAPEESFGEGSLSRALGGVAVECGEVQILAPNGRTAPEIVGGWQRGRHHRLNLYMGTQRVSACDRIVTSQSDVVAIFAQSEAIDLDRVRKQYGRYAADDVAQLAPHWCITARQGQQHYDLLDPDRRVTKRVRRLDGRELPTRGAA